MVGRIMRSAAPAVSTNHQIRNAGAPSLCDWGRTLNYVRACLEFTEWVAVVTCPQIFVNPVDSCLSKSGVNVFTKKVD